MIPVPAEDKTDFLPSCSAHRLDRSSSYIKFTYPLNNLRSVNTDRRKEALDVFVRLLSAAPDSLVKSLTGKEYAKHAIEEAREFEVYLFPDYAGKPKK